MIFIHATATVSLSLEDEMQDAVELANRLQCGILLTVEGVQVEVCPQSVPFDVAAQVQTVIDAQRAEVKALLWARATAGKAGKAVIEEAEPSVNDKATDALTDALNGSYWKGKKAQ